MEPGNLYELVFPFERGQGSKKRPVLIIVISGGNDKALGLKVTSTGPNEKFPFRIKIENSPQAHLKHTSYIQYNLYQWFDNVKLKPRGRLSEEDFRKVIAAFKEFHNL